MKPGFASTKVGSTARKRELQASKDKWFESRPGGQLLVLDDMLPRRSVGRISQAVEVDGGEIIYKWRSHRHPLAPVNCTKRR
jgi:hypothetical protein